MSKKLLAKFWEEGPHGLADEELLILVLGEEYAKEVSTLFKKRSWSEIKELVGPNAKPVQGGSQVHDEAALRHEGTRGSVVRLIRERPAAPAHHAPFEIPRVARSSLFKKKLKRAQSKDIQIIC